jgi:hypothetical protein
LYYICTQDAKEKVCSDAGREYTLMEIRRKWKHVYNTLQQHADHVTIYRSIVEADSLVFGDLELEAAKDEDCSEFKGW